MYWTDVVAVIVSILALGLSGYIFFNFERKHKEIGTRLQIDDNQIRYFSFMAELIKAMRELEPSARELLIKRLENAGFFVDEDELLSYLKERTHN